MKWTSLPSALHATWLIDRHRKKISHEHYSLRTEQSLVQRMRKFGKWGTWDRWGLCVSWT